MLSSNPSQNVLTSQQTSHPNKQVQQLLTMTKFELPRPKAPLTAYNLYFQVERKRILAGTDHLKAPITISEVREASREHMLRGKRLHRKSHGVISFRDLARTVANRWKKLDSDTKQLLEEQAIEEKKEFANEFKRWLLAQDTPTQGSRGAGPNGADTAAAFPRSQPSMQQPFSCLGQQQSMAENHNASLAILTALHSIQELIDVEMARISAAQLVMLPGQAAASSPSSHPETVANAQMWNPIAQQSSQAVNGSNSTPTVFGGTVPTAFGSFPQQLQQQQEQRGVKNRFQLDEDLTLIDWSGDNDSNEGTSSSLAMFPASIPSNHNRQASAFRTTYEGNFAMGNTRKTRQNQQDQSFMLGDEPLGTMLQNQQDQSFSLGDEPLGTMPQNQQNQSFVLGDGLLGTMAQNQQDQSFMLGDEPLGTMPHQQKEEQVGSNTMARHFKNNTIEQSTFSNPFDSSVDLFYMWESLDGFSNPDNAMNQNIPNASS